MLYATEQQFIDAFGFQETVELSNLEDANYEEINSAVLERALTDATAEIDSYLQGRYSLPLVTLPVTLTPVCLNIARYRLDSRQARDDVRKRYEDALRFLTLLATGKVSLGLGALNEEIKARDVQMPDFFQGERLYTSDTLKDF